MSLMVHIVSDVDCHTVLRCVSCVAAPLYGVQGNRVLDFDDFIGP